MFQEPKYPKLLHLKSKSSYSHQNLKRNPRNRSFYMRNATSSNPNPMSTPLNSKDIKYPISTKSNPKIRSLRSRSPIRMVVKKGAIRK